MNLYSACICKKNKVSIFKPKIVYKNEKVFTNYEGLTIGKCIYCGIMKTIPHGNNKFRNTFTSKVEFYEDNPEIFRKYFDTISRTIIKYKKSGRLLDVGCASGIFLEIMQKRGFNVSGIEPNKKAFLYSHKKFGNKVFHGQLKDFLKFRKPFYDVILYNHVLEHIADVVTEFKLINKVLPKGGLFIVGLPNTGNIIYFLRHKYWESLLPDQHIWHFSTNYAKQLLERSGFRILEISFNNHLRSDYHYLKKIYFSFLNFINKIINSGEAMVVIAEKL